MEAVVILAHQYNGELRELLAQVQMSTVRKVFLMIDADALRLQPLPPVPCAVVPVSFSQLSKTYHCALPGFEKPYPGFLDVPLYPFLLQNKFSALWRIEYDVRFMGFWDSMFDEYANADFVGGYIEEPAEGWAWNYCARQPNGTRRLMSFAPVMKVSKQLAIVADAARRKDSTSGWGGHFESFLPSLAYWSRMKIDSLIPKFATRETFRFVPAIDRTEPFVDNMLYHPVK